MIEANLLTVLLIPVYEKPMKTIDDVLGEEVLKTLKFLVLLISSL